MARIGIIGGHGKVALALARILTGEGHQVTSFFRKPQQAARVGATGARPVVLDVESASTAQLTEAIEGQEVLIWSAGAGGGNPERTYAVDRDAAIRSMDAAHRAGVDRYVMVSYLESDLDHDVPEDSSFFAYAEAKAAADAYLRNTGLSWTILGPGLLTQDAPSGRITTGRDAGRNGRDTSRGNVALVAAAVIEERSTLRRTMRFVDGETPIGEALAEAT